MLRNASPLVSARTLLVLSSVALVAMAGCLSPSTDGQGKLTKTTAALIDGARLHKGGLGTVSYARIMIEMINGHSRLGRWNPKRYYALVKPGEYTFTVRVSSEDPTVDFLMMDAEQIEDRNSFTRRRLKLVVESGFTYRIHPGGSEADYLVHRSKTRMKPEKGSWEAPQDAWLCLPAQGKESTSNAILYCNADNEAESLPAELLGPQD